MKKLYNLVINLGLILGILIFILIVGEIGLRIVGIKYLVLRKDVDENFFYIF